MSKTIFIRSEIWMDEGYWDIEEMKHISKPVHTATLEMIYNPLYDGELDFSKMVVVKETDTSVTYQAKSNREFHNKMEKRKKKETSLVNSIKNLKSSWNYYCQTLPLSKREEGSLYEMFEELNKRLNYELKNL